MSAKKPKSPSADCCKENIIHSKIAVDKSLQELQKENEELDREIAELHARGITGNLQLQMAALHKYNEMKDLTLKVLEYLSNAEQVPVMELYRRYDLPTDQ